MPITTTRNIPYSRLERAKGSPVYLPRYLAEYDFRYNERVAHGVNNAERTMRALSGIVGKSRDSLAAA